jgi:desulfoferrodoxin (superoxide reductase-like protein)
MENNITKNYVTSLPKVLVFLLAITLALSSCSRKVDFASSALVPSAEGYVKVKQDKNKNFQISVNVKHLAHPNRLSPPKEHYVVWIQTQGNQMENIGQLRISKSLNGSLTAITSFEPIRVVITAEDQANTRVPSEYEVLNTTAFY